MTIEDGLDPFIRRARYDILATPLYIRKRVIYDYELLYIKAGTPIITIGETIYHARKGDVFLLHPGVPHIIDIPEKGIFTQPHVHFDLRHYSDCRDVTVNFRPLEEMTEAEKHQIRPDIFRQIYPSFPDCIHLKDTQRFELALFDLIQCFEADLPMRDMQLRWMFDRVLCQLLEEWRYKIAEEKGDNFALLEQMHLYLEHNMDRPVSLQTIGQIFHMNSTYLGRIFKQHYGMSPIHCHREMRISRGKDLLRYTDVSVTNIAVRLGYNGVNEFSRAFKQATGVSPMQYRRTYGEEINAE